MQQQRTTKERLLASQDMPLSRKQTAFKDIERAMFFSRMAQLQLLVLERSQLLSGEFRDGAHKAGESLRGLDQKIRHFLPEKIGKSLTLELSKEKIWDFCELMETLVGVNTPEYEQLLELMVHFLQAITLAKLPAPDYKALITFFTNELKAEREGDKPGIIAYDQRSNSIIFKLPEPHAVK
jgi:hypothetical protein